MLTPSQSTLLQSNALAYLAGKANLSVQQVEKKIINCESLEIKGEGLDLDTHIMEEVLKEHEFYEKPHQKMMKDDAMRFVKNIVEEWSVEIARNEIKISKDQIPNYTAKALPFGSYVLDLRSNNSDIDLVCVCPSFINMDTHFFGELAQKIERSSDVTGISLRTGATVPIITFDFKDINIDVSFCQLGKETVPRDIEKVISTELVAAISDKKSKTALLGRKNNLMILELTGRQAENFKQTLRVIKVWAKNRGISSNGMGYLGGISWALLLAKICQIFPNHKPNRLFYEFFRVFSLWNWKAHPVLLMAAEYQQQMERKDFSMFVATPGTMYNSTERVNRITFRVLMEEIKRAATLLMSNREIRQVCRKSDFIDRYPIFLQIDICGENKSKEDERDYKDFQGNVESKVLILLTNIIKFNKKQLQEGTLTIVPNPHLYKKNDEKYPLCNCILLGIDLKDVPVELGTAVKEWMATIDKLARQGKMNLNLRAFKTKKDLMENVEVTQTKKKEEKEDPRLKNRTKKPVDSIKPSK